MLKIMSENETEIPVVESDQVGVLSSAVHSQSVMITLDGEENFLVMWDGSVLRLMQPAGVDMDNAIIAYKVLGHLEVSLPFPLDPVTMERQAQFLVHAYKDDGEGSEEDETAEEE